MLYVFGNELEAPFLFVLFFGDCVCLFAKQLTGRAVRRRVFGDCTVFAYSQNNFREEQSAVILLVTVLCLPIHKTTSGKSGTPSFYW